MRPDRIIVGEVRSGEALDMVQSMISGHSGSLTTVHSDSPRNAMVRLGNITEVDAMFTNEQPPAELVEVMKLNEVGLHVAEKA